MYDINTLIKSKNNKQEHSLDKINFIVNGFINNKISERKMTKWLKAVYHNDMNFSETVNYTNAIINSGKKIQFKNLNGYIIDKHSTGGIGDKVSIILGPILAACGCYVPMIVGRLLGHTGGTLDKLESIKGYDGLLPINKFSKIVKNIGISIIGQTDEICPADRKIYELRGRTNTVASFPLICGSIMSKKIAEGIKGLVLDIKRGNGAFIKDSKEANKLGRLLTLIGSEFNVEVKYINTNMDQPLGKSAGLLCEIIECIEALEGKGSNDLMQVVFDLGELALKMAKQKKPREKMLQVINNGSALEVLYKMIYEHGGDLKKIRLDPKKSTDIFSNKKGILQYVNTKEIGNAVNFLTITNGKKDIHAGIQFFKKNNDMIDEKDLICKIFSSNSKNIDIAKKMIQQTYIIND